MIWSKVNKRLEEVDKRIEQNKQTLQSISTVVMQLRASTETLETILTMLMEEEATREEEAADDADTSR